MQNLSRFMYPAPVSIQMSKIPKAVSEYLAKIGSKGGSAKTPAKAKAVRANGKLGGRPRKRKAAR